MNNYKIFAFTILIAFLISSCKQSQEARKPISQTSGSFIKKSAERNRKLIATEEGQIAALIKSEPKRNYLASDKGYWFSYLIQNKVDTLTPKKGDVAFFEYEIKDLNGKIIYSQADLKPQTYAIDKQNIMTGLREGIKLMRKKEKLIFLFPSHIAYGYHGDDKKIGSNQPIMCILTLHNFISEIAFKKEIQLRKENNLNQATTETTNLETKPQTPIKDSIIN